MNGILSALVAALLLASGCSEFLGGTGNSENACGWGEGACESYFNLDSAKTPDPGTEAAPEQTREGTPKPTPDEAPKQTPEPAPEATETPERAPAPGEGTGRPEAEIPAFLTSKEVYSSKEELNITVVINSTLGVDGIEVRLYGIQARGRNWIDRTTAIDLNKGRNTLVFNETTPNCTSGCGGIYPGPYDLNIELWAGGKLLAKASKAIELVKG